MYVELTPEDTLRDLQGLLIDSLPGFEFPRIQLLDNYVISVIKKNVNEISIDDFVIGITPKENEEDVEEALVDQSSFKIELNSEEINIIAILMMCGWVQRQVTSIENTRMKYSGSDFKMTSQANHGASIMIDTMTKYDFYIAPEAIEKNVARLTNQMWKLIPMKENNEDWEKQLNTVILEIAGLNELFLKQPLFLQLLSKLEGIKIISPEFKLYRKTVFESIGLLRRLCQ